MLTPTHFSELHLFIFNTAAMLILFFGLFVVVFIFLAGLKSAPRLGNVACVWFWEAVCAGVHN